MKHLAFFLFISFCSVAQLHEVAEVSMVLPDDLQEDIELVATDDDELLLVNLQEDYLKKTDKNLNIIKFNTDLKQEWVVYIPIERIKVPINYRVTNERLYYLVSAPDSRKFELIIVELSTGQWSKHAFESLTKLINLDFEVFNGYILVSGEYNQKPVVEMHSISINAAKVLPELHYKNTLIKGINVNPYRNELYVFTALTNKCQTNVIVYDQTGKVLSKHTLGDKKHKVSNLQVRFSTDGEPFVLGTYNNVCNDLVAGFFSGSLDQSSKLNYNEISNFSSYNNSLSSKRLERKLLRKEKGKSSSARQKVLFSVPFSGENGYVASGEIFTQQTVQVPVNSRIETNGRRINLPAVYDYRINKLVLAELGFDGKVNYDNLVKVEGKNFNSLRPQTAYLFKNDNFYGVFPTKKDLGYVNMSQANDPVKSYDLFPDTKYKISDVEVELLSWGSNTLLAYGVAYLEFSNAQYNSTKQLYFIKKLEIGN